MSSRKSILAANLISDYMLHINVIYDTCAYSVVGKLFNLIRKMGPETFKPFPKIHYIQKHILGGKFI